jgi:hypothetical protein
MAQQDQVVVKTYKGSESDANIMFHVDAASMAVKGYSPAAQSWAPGNYSCGAFIFALLLCLIFIGILVFIYMLIVKPAGTLTVTYELRLAAPEASAAEKTCRDAQSR